jgi:hypothetical protein
MVGKTLFWRTIDRFASWCAWLWPSMFSFQFVFVATRLEDVDDILERTLASGTGDPD